MYRHFGASTYLLLQFLVEAPEGLAFVVPDTESFRYTILGRDNLPLFTSDPIDVSGTEYLITIPAEYTEKADGTLFETRTVIYTFMTNGRYISRTVLLTLLERLPISVTEDTVRNKLGVSASEVPDDMIDLPKRYYQFLNRYATVDVPTLLVASGFEAMQLNEAIAIFAAIETIPALQLKAMMSQQAGVDRVARFPVDFSVLETQLWAKLDYLMGTVKMIISPMTPIFYLSKPIDPFNPYDDVED